MSFSRLNIDEDCIFIVAYFNAYCIERSKFVVELFFRPTDKPKALLGGWSIDLITNVELVSLERYCHCIIAIDYLFK